MEGTQPLPHMSEPPTVRAAIISPLGHAGHTAQTTGQQHTKGTNRGQRPRRPRPAEAADWVPVCTTSAPPPPDVTDHRTMQPAGVRLLAVRPTAPRPETERLPHGVHTGNRRLYDASYGDGHQARPLATQASRPPAPHTLLTAHTPRPAKRGPAPQGRPKRAREDGPDPQAAQAAPQKMRDA